MRIICKLLMVFWVTSVQADGLELQDPGGGAAISLTGSSVLDGCGREDDWNGGACAGIIVAYADALRHQGKVCQPEEVTYEQVRDVFVNFLKTNPIKRQSAAYPLAERAFREAWTCP